MRTMMTAAAFLAFLAFPAAAAAPAAPPSKAVKAQLEKGYKLKDEGKTEEAISAFSAVLKKDPTNHAATVELGYLNAGLKHWSTAVKYLAAASKQDPDNQRLHMDLGYGEQELKQYDAAAKQFKLVSEQPGEFQAQAQGALEAVKSAGADAKQRRVLEQGYAALKRGDKAAARAKFEAALQNDPQNTAALKQLGFLDLESNKLASAAERFEAVRQQEPGDYFTALQLGYVYQRLKKGDEARSAFNAALASTDPKVRDAADAALKASGAGPGVEAKATATTPPAEPAGEAPAPSL